MATRKSGRVSFGLSDLANTFQLEIIFILRKLKELILNR